MTYSRTFALLSLLSTVMWGCASQYHGDREIIDAMTSGDYGQARAHALSTASSNYKDRAYLLDRQKILWSALAEGDTRTAAAAADYTYDQLRTQGVNAGKALGRFFLGDQEVQVWKGEPFEQAAGFTAVAICDGLLGHWGNMRASALGSQFQIKDLSSVIEGERETNELSSELSDRELLVAAAQRADEETGTEGDSESDEFEEGIPLRASDYEPGYALAAVAERQLGLTDEMRESLRQLTAVNPELRELANQIASGRYNTVIIADYGLAPKKVRTGPDGAIAAYAARTASDTQPLVVSSTNGQARFPVLTDYNRLATDLEWNNFEDVRVAKSYIGSGLVVIGATYAMSGGTDEAIAGAAIALAGLALKASAGADTRHCEALPQRTYLALLDLPERGGQVSVSIDGLPSAHAELPGLSAPEPGELQLIYTRLPVSPIGAVQFSSVPQYANDMTGPLRTGPTLPFILGGACVRTPSEETLAEYHRAGLPDWVNLADLERMYAEEGIVTPAAAGYPIGRHVLEGGDALYTPAAGSQGFERLFYQSHLPYTPAGPTAQEILAAMNPAGTTN